DGDVPLTDEPVLAEEESPIEPPSDFGPGVVRCPQCGYRNMPAWGRCYACGTELALQPALPSGPSVKTIASFEDSNPFSGGSVTPQHATVGSNSLRVDRSYVLMDGDQDWTGYDYLKADVFSTGVEPQGLYVEIRDTATRDYWTRVNYETVVPPGASTLVIPIRQLYVGEKSRPGRMLIASGITRLVFSIGDHPLGPLFLDNIRLERDDSARRAVFDGLYAFDLGLSTSPVMEGFTAITPGTLYSPGRGYGLNDAKIWRSFDALQPDPLYQDFVCIESGGIAVDVPDGRYRVWVNMDNPSGYWGEYQVYRRRAILAEGHMAAEDKMDFESLKAKYFRFWNVEDLPDDNTFDKYQQPYYDEKQFEVDVQDGQLNLEFQGENWACSVSAVVIFPVDQAAAGQRFLEYVQRQRRFHFDNYFKRVLHTPTGDSREPIAEDRRRGYVGFVRDWMRDVYYNDTPFVSEVGRPLRGEAFAGEYEPLTISLRPMRDLGEVALTAGELTGPAGTIPAACIEVGYVSYRVSRVTMQGSVYTIRPRMIMPSGVVSMPDGVTRRFWLTVKTPADARPGEYRGYVSIRPEHGDATCWPVEFRVRAGTLDTVDIPAGPWGYQIDIPWRGGESEAAEYNREMARKSLRKMREYGFTAFSGVPTISYRGFADD
ncbi:MAG: hypothetical protein JJ992_08230, partial [Planctomycetes bacterium]|nr:hypothetical protein [Planctomycetota bacterium]